jgi:hypothetical protein
MEEVILKIIELNYNSETGIISSPKASKEITSMVFEFIKWFTGKDSPVSILYGGSTGTIRNYRKGLYD